MSFPLIKKESKQTMNELVEILNSTVEFDPSIGFTTEENHKSDEYKDFWD